uniref:Uncharacterized protein n=1 Tax=Helianthus annuus TaxID=4232 RepID=A0A251VQP4_HELAN
MPFIRFRKLKHISRSSSNFIHVLDSHYIQFEHSILGITLAYIRSSFLRKSGTYNTLLRVSSFPEVHFKITVPSPMMSAVAAFPIYSFSSPESALKVVKRLLSAQT